MKKLISVVAITVSGLAYSQSIDPKVKNYIDEMISKRVNTSQVSHSKFNFNGYFRAGSNLMLDGASKSAGACYSLNYPKNDGAFYRLGNSCRDYGGFDLTHSNKSNGLKYKFVFSTDYGADQRSPTSNESWSARSRQMYIELDEVFGGSASLWMGRKIISGQNGVGDLHIYDSSITQSAGNGFGVSNIKRGKHTIDFSVTGYGSESTSKNINSQSYLLDVRDNIKVGENSLQVVLQNLFVTHADGTNSRREGTTLTTQFSTKNNKLGLQIARGSLSENPGCAGTDGGCFNNGVGSSSFGFRVYNNGQVKLSSKLLLNHLIIYQKSNDFHALLSAGLRPHYILSKYWSLLAEFSHDNYKRNNETTQNLSKFTFALQATPNSGKFFARPSLRFYISHFKWDQSARQYSGLSVPGKANAEENSIIGVNGEIWF